MAKKTVENLGIMVRASGREWSKHLKKDGKKYSSKKIRTIIKRLLKSPSNLEPNNIPLIDS